MKNDHRFRKRVPWELSPPQYFFGEGSILQLPKKSYILITISTKKGPDIMKIKLTKWKSITLSIMLENYNVKYNVGNLENIPGVVQSKLSKILMT